MSKKKRRYPRLGTWRPYKVVPCGAKCTICQEDATGSIEIQTNWFRGDDETFPRCKNHWNSLDTGRGERK